MFSFFRSKKITSSLFKELKTDFHSHLIPGIDDGAKTVEDSLELIRGLHELGYRKIITTPHIYYDIYPNTREVILSGLETMRQAINEAGIDIELHAAAEYFIDPHFEKLLAKKELLPVFDNSVLVEISFLAAPPNLEQVIFTMRTKGYDPILAHPERYSFFGDNLSRYQRLKDMGCQFQLNLLSLGGRYGPQVQKTAEFLLKNNMIDYLCTDLHNREHLGILQELAFSKMLGKWMGKRAFGNNDL